MAHHISQMSKGSKTEFLQIRLTLEDRERIARVAKSEYLEPSTWARQVILRAVEAWEVQSGQEKQ